MSIFSRSSRLRASVALAAVATLCAVSRMDAQSTRLADSLLQSGVLVRAESLYYAAVRARPSDPNARQALGRYLVSRGAPRVGATLLEEAIRFGGDKPAIERELAPIYLATGEFHSLAALSAAPQAERDRAKYLVANETRTIAPDSTVAVAFRASSDSATIGRVAIRINGKSFDAAVDSRAHGIVISDRSAGVLHLHIFPAPGSNDHGHGVLAVADTVAMGGLSIRNAAVTIGRVDGEHQIAVGLDALSRFSPTFDPAAATLTLHVASAIPATIAGDRHATLAGEPDMRVLESGSWVPMSKALVSLMLRGHRWTLDSRRGQIVVEL
jgi:hypothetical protein